MIWASHHPKTALSIPARTTMTSIILYAHQHPTRAAAIVLAAFLVPIWWLTGDYSPVEAMRSVGGF
jgi:hypothetical protein